MQAVAIGAAVIMIFKAAETVDAANLSVIITFRAVIASIIGYIFLNLVFEPQQVIGMLLIILAAFTVSKPEIRKSKLTKGTLFAVAGATIYGIGLVFEKEAIKLTGLKTYMVIGWGMQGLIFLVFSWRNLLKESKSRIRRAAPSLLLLGVLIFMSGALYVTALDSIDNTGLLLAFINLKTILIVLGGLVFLGERSMIGIKLTGGALAVIGAALLVV